MSANDFQKLAALFPDEVVTHSYVQDIERPDGAGTFALITLDNGLDHSKPTTLGPNTLVELGGVLEALRDRPRPAERRRSCRPRRGRALGFRRGRRQGRGGSKDLQRCARPGQGAGHHGGQPDQDPGGIGCP